MARERKILFLYIIFILNTKLLQIVSFAVYSLSVTAMQILARNSNSQLALMLALKEFYVLGLGLNLIN